MTSTTPSAPALSFDEIMEQGSPTEELVPLCLNGRLRREYEEVAARIEARREDRAAARTVAEHNRARQDDDDARLNSKPSAADVPDEAGFRDPEQDTADRLIAEMKRYTVVFRLVAMGPRWNELLEAHPPRKDPTDAKRNDPRDWEGVNAATFYPAMIRAALASPEMTDERWDKLLNGPARVSDAQFDRLGNAAKNVNRQDADLPFSLTDLGSPPS